MAHLISTYLMFNLSKTIYLGDAVINISNTILYIQPIP